MAQTIIDALVVTLGLDPKEFNKGRDDVKRGFKGTREESEKTGKDLTSDAKRAGEAIGKLRNEAIGLFVAFQGASSITGWLGDLITGDAATGRLAANIGVATQELSAWQLAVKTVAGDSKDADAALTSIAQAFQTMQLEGVVPHWAEFQLLGVTRADLANPTATLLKMAEASERLGKTEFFAVLTRIGIPPSVINLLEKGRSGLSALIDEKKRDAAVSDENSKKAQQLEARWADLTAKLNEGARPAIYGVVDGLTKMLDAANQSNATIPILTGVIGAAAVAAGIAAGPWVLLAAAIAAVKVAGDSLISSHPKVRSFLDDIEAPLKNALGPKWSWLFDRPGDAPSGGGAGGGSGGAGGGGQSGPLGDAKHTDAIEAYLRNAGLTEKQAHGITAGIVAEGGSLGFAKNGAYGLGQWRGDRQKKLFAKYGPNPTLGNQLEFLVSELRGGDKGGASVLAQSTSLDALIAYVVKFMRPDLPGTGNKFARADIDRGSKWMGIAMPNMPAEGGGSSSTTTTVGTINVYTAATDGAGIAADLPRQIAKRGLTNQADRGQQ